MRRPWGSRMIARGLDRFPLRRFTPSPQGDDSLAARRRLLAAPWLVRAFFSLSLYCLAVRTLAGRLPGWLVRKGLMSSPPRRV